MRGKKSFGLAQPILHAYFAVLLLFAAVSAAVSIPLAIAEAAAAAALYVLFRRGQHRRRREVLKYIDSVAGTMGEAARDSMVNSPLPILIFHPENGEIIWSNERFLAQTESGDPLFDRELAAVVPGFQTRWLMEGKTECPEEVVMGTRRFQVFGNLVRGGGRGELLALTYWFQITELADARDKYVGSRPVVSVLMLDNYEDVMKNISDTVRASMSSEIERRLAEWTDTTGGLLCRVNRDRYIFVFEEQYLREFMEQKFSILDAIREVHSPAGMPCTLSVGIGIDAESFTELLRYANLSVEMALSRGGDQAVIKNRFTFEFFGGRTRETEKRTKVKSRVMASALAALMGDSSQVFVMGHKFADLDAVGAAAGVCAVARKREKPFYIVRETGPFPASEMLGRLEETPEYEGRVISAQDALVLADGRSLLIVVDTNRPDQVLAEDLLASCNKVAVIDHHRRAASYIADAALNFHEPYASSTCELVTELLQYIAEPGDMTRIEAEALLAGIVLDTKNFTMRTGARTFEAAAFLRRAGADSAEVKKLFENNLEDTVARYSIVQNARMYRRDVAVACMMEPVPRVTAAQAADELLNIAGVDASFVLAPEGERVIISARSMGEMNVQMVLESLGGGGNGAAAGAQVPGEPEEVLGRLHAAIDAYCREE